MKMRLNQSQISQKAFHRGNSRNFKEILQKKLIKNYYISLKYQSLTFGAIFKIFETNFL